MLMKKIYFITFILIILTSGCVEKQEKINLGIAQEPGLITNDSSVKVAIASVISPKASYVFYDEMIKYISRKLGGRVKIVQKRDYEGSE